jgi:TonB family protein
MFQQRLFPPIRGAISETIQTRASMSSSALIRAAVLLCAGAFAAQPANAQRARDPLLLSDKPAPREGCAVARLPNPLPSVGALADSAALTQAVDEFARKYPLRDGQKMFAVYSVAFGADGQVARVSPIDWFLPRDREQELTGLVRQSVRAQPAGQPRSVRLRVEPGAEPALRVGRSEVCAARSTSRFELLTQAMEASTTAPLPVRVRVSVRESGEIAAIHILRSSGDRELDRWVEQSLLRRRYTPELVDGVAVAVEREEEVRIRYRR